MGLKLIPQFLQSTVLGRSLLNVSDKTEGRSLLDAQAAINFAGRNIIYVSKRDTATDTRTGLNKYDENYPFATHVAAFAASSAGDVIIAEPGIYDERLPIKNGTSYIQLCGTQILYTGSDSEGVIDDSSGPLQCDIIVYSLARTGAGTTKPLIKLSNATSGCNIQFYALSNSAGKVFELSNGSHTIIGSICIGQSSVGAISVSGGFHYINIQDYIYAENGDAVSVSGGTLYFKGNQITASDTDGFVLTGGNILAEVLTITAVTNCINSSGTATADLNFLKSSGKISVGSGSTVNLRTNNTSAVAHSVAGTLNLFDSKLKITGSSEATMDIASNDLSLRNVVLVAGASATNCLTAGSAKTVNVYSAWSNKPVDSDITQQIDLVTINSNVQ